ncbi:hypothetical protein PQX77_001680 [Marasmius sp. AFHP31]|nr:hypothetical protein PQX77_001680 [Marasmius sp. AFHP31]
MLLLLAALSYRQLDPDSTAPTCLSCPATRTTVNVFWSCLSIIILCTWTSVRPNVPSVPRSGHWVLICWDKAAIFFVALLAPEIIVLWSVRQRLAAQKMVEGYKDRGWTMSHAFFALMGGFALYDSEGKFLFHLWDERFCGHHKDEGGWDGFSKQQRKLEKLLPLGRDQSYSSLLEYCVVNNMITITEEEIQNLGHTDLLTKAITIIQTLQFITNCVARGVSGLAITELEFLTLGFAALNLVSYSFWWHKPSGIDFPVRIMDISKFIPPEQPSVAQDKNEESNFTVRLGTDTPAMPTEARAPGILSVLWDRIRNDYIDGEWNTYDLGHKTLWILRVPLKIFWQTINYALDGDVNHNPQPERGNIFSGGNPDYVDESPLPSILMFSTAVILGVFYCIPIMLNYRDFPGHIIDHHLWTAFALATTVLPLVFLIMHIFEKYRNTDGEFTLPGVFVALSVVAFHPLARIALMVLAVKQLTDLPSAALRRVDWTNLIPHLGT